MENHVGAKFCYKTGRNLRRNLYLLKVAFDEEALSLSATFDLYLLKVAFGEEALSLSAKFDLQEHFQKWLISTLYPILFG